MKAHDARDNKKHSHSDHMQLQDPELGPLRWPRELFPSCSYFLRGESRRENKVLSAISPFNCSDLEGTLIALFLRSFFSKIGTSEIPFYRSIQHSRSARKRELYFPLELGRLMTNDNG